MSEAKKGILPVERYTPEEIYQITSKWTSGTYSMPTYKYPKLEEVVGRTCESCGKEITGYHALTLDSFGNRWIVTCGTDCALDRVNKVGTNDPQLWLAAKRFKEHKEGEKKTLRNRLHQFREEIREVYGV